MLHPWETIASRHLVKDKWITLRADTCRRDDGLVIDPYYVLEERDWVHVLPVLPDGRILLVHQYRHAAATFSLELPGGVLDDGETPEQGARRELLEECGATAGQFAPLTSFFPNPARLNNRFHCFIAHHVSPSTDQQLDEAEQIEILALTPAEIDAAIADGRFSQGNHIAAYLLARPSLVI